MFGFTAFVSVHWSVWAQIFARFIWPRIGAATELEDAHPVRFAQFIGFVLTALALLGFVIGVDGIGYGLTAVAVVGAVLIGLGDAGTGAAERARAYWPVGSPSPPPGAASIAAMLGHGTGAGTSRISR